MTTKKMLIIKPNEKPYLAIYEHNEVHGASSVIHDIVGNWFDCVRSHDIVGYVDDEGLLRGLPLNPVATAIFGRILAGTCVVVGSLNPQGESDGEDYDVPEDALARISWAWGANQIWLEHQPVTA